MGSSKLRKTCSFTSLLLSFLNFSLFILSASSFAPTILLKMPPTSFGLALLMVSGISVLSSFVGFYSQLTHFCFLTHISLLLASLIGQVLSILALFTKERASMSLLKSPRDPKEAKLLVRLECGALMAMCMLQCVVLMLSCAVHNCWVKDYEELNAEKEASARKRSRRIAEVQEESMANATKMAEMKAKELDEKMKHKYGKWVKTDFEPWDWGFSTFCSVFLLPRTSSADICIIVCFFFCWCWLFRVTMRVAIEFECCEHSR